MTDDYRDEDDEWDDFEDENDDEPTVPCPHCRQEIHEDSQRCPHCEQYISQEDSPRQLKPRWVIIGAVMCLLVLVTPWIFQFVAFLTKR